MRHASPITMLCCLLVACDPGSTETAAAAAAPAKETAAKESAPKKEEPPKIDPAVKAKEDAEATRLALLDLGGEDTAKQDAAKKKLVELGDAATPTMIEAAKAVIIVYDRAKPEEKFDVLFPVMRWKDVCGDMGRVCVPLFKELAHAPHPEVSQLACTHLFSAYEIMCVADGTFNEKP